MDKIPNRSGVTFPAMGIGCWSYGGGDYWGLQAQSDVDEVVGTALDNGINFFDTAAGYNEGRSEESLVIALKSRRQEAVIGRKPGDVNPQTLSQQLESSLRRLQRDYVEKILDLHSSGDKWRFLGKIGDSKFNNTASTVDYFIGHTGRTYSIPLITTNDKLTSGENSVIINRIHHTKSRNAYYHWWAKEHKKFSLDELPQLYSVLKGDMSFIGPRPAGFNEYPEYQEWQYRKLSVKPGISCLWQVEGRNDIASFEAVSYTHLTLPTILLV